MPQAIAAGAAYIATYAATYTALSYGVAYALAYAAGTYALNAALDKAMGALQRDQAKGAGSGLEISSADAAADGRIIYGRVRVGGIQTIPPACSGDDGDILHQILSLCVHEVDSFESVYFDQDEITNASIGGISGNANDGLVNSSSAKYENKAWIRRYAGTASQNVDYILNAAFPSSWPSTSRGRGIAYAALSFKYGNGKTYSGAPAVTLVVKGKKCYDPRLDVSPGANPTNPSYIAWTQCPALIWADFKMSQVYGQKVLSTDIDWDSVVAAADVCDELVDIPGGGTQARYTFNGILFTSNDTTDNEKDIIDAMMGKFAYTDGKHRIFAGAWRAPVYEINKEDWLSINDLQGTASRGDRFNGVQVFHVDPDRNWQRVESFRRFSDTYKSADGNERIWIPLEQPHCTNKYEAERKGEFMLRQSRNGIMLTGSLPPRFMRLRTWDNVSVYFDEMGWAAKSFTVASCAIDENGSVNVTLIEEQDSDWTDLLDSEYGSPSVSGFPTTNQTKPSAPQNVVITGLPGIVAMDWDIPVTRPIGTRYRVIVANSPNNAAIGTTAWEGEADYANIPMPDPFPKYFWVQAYVNSYYGPYQPNTTGTLARALPVDDNTFSQRVIADEEFNFDTGSLHWVRRRSSPTGETMNSSYAILQNMGLSGNGVLRHYCAASVNLQMQQVIYAAKRAPLLTARANQVVSFYIRFRRDTLVNTGFVAMRFSNTTSAWFYNHVDSVGLGDYPQVRGDGKDTVFLPHSVMVTASNWYSAQGQLVSVNTIDPSKPFIAPAIQINAPCSGGVIDIDKISMWLSNSTALVGTYVIS